MKSANTAFVLSALTALTLGAPASDIFAQQECEAPYRENDGAYEGHYVVAFAEGYTLEEHFDFLGGAIAIEGTLNKG